MSNIKKLKDLRLHLIDTAIRGKLVEQRAEEGTAQELFDKIQKEKQELIKAGKLKKEKALPEISDDEIPFEIPKSWKWFRICQLVETAKQSTPTQKFRYIDVSAINNKTKTIENLSEYSHDKAPSRARKIVQKGMVLFSVVRPYFLNTVIYKDEIKNLPVFASTAFASFMCNKNVFNKYLWYVMQSLYFFKYVTKKQRGASYPAINEKDFYSGCIPLPPLDEQKRIVEKLESHLNVIDKAIDLLERKAELDEALKQKILQMAIQGKLVEQKAEDGTAQELFDKIQKEKDELIKAGKLKKEKALSEISEDEIPFEIPESWKWVRIGDIFQHNTGKALKSSDKEGVELEYLTTSNVYWDSILTSDLRKMFFKENELERCTIQKGDLLVCEGGDFGRSCIWDQDLPMCIQNHIHKLRPFLYIEVIFYYYIFYVYKRKGLLTSRGIGIQSLSSDALHKIIVPLPPLNEQKRIVAKIESLLSILDKR